MPLVGPTKLIMGMSIDNYQWHEIFPENGNIFISPWLSLPHILLVRRASFNSHIVTATETHNISVIIAIWAPIILVSLVARESWSDKLIPLL